MRLLKRLLNFLTGHRSDERFREETEFHVVARAEENIRAGMSPDEAERQARLMFGHIEAIREDYRAEEGVPLMENALQDIGYAFRVLRKSPGFTTVVLLTLMLGIGANVAVFGVVNAILLQPLAVSDPDSLYQIRHKQWMRGRLLFTSYPGFEDIQRRNTTFSGMAGVYGYSAGSLRWGNAVTKVSGDEVTGNYFDVLGVRPGLGRFFHAADEHGPGSAPYVVLSDGLWHKMFQANRNVVGKIVELNRHPFTVLGVATAEFHGLERFVWPDYWIPMMNEEQVEESDYLHNRTSISVTVIGRLKPGVFPQQATENLNAISAELARLYPKIEDGQAVRLIHPGLFGDQGDLIREFLWSVTVLALLVLAAACANLGSLFAARAADRTRELALRVALGASRARLVRQLLTEAVLVSLMGGAAGLWTASTLLGALNRWHSSYGLRDVSVDSRVYLVGLALTLGSALLFGMVPARQAWISSPLQVMKSGAREGTHPGRVALREILLGVQISICTLLVTASLVAVRGMENALRAPLGFQPQGALLADLDLSELRRAGDLTAEKEKVLIEAARNIPGVTAVGTVNRTPMTGGIHGSPIFQPGTTEFKLNNSALSAYVFQISPGYLEAAGTRLRGGRDVSWHDTSKTPAVAIVNETFARKMWGVTPAMGKHFVVSGKLAEVVGVAEDGKYHDLQEAPYPAIYLPVSQSEQGETVFVVRSRRTPGEMTAALEQKLSGLAPDVTVAVRNWSDDLESELFPARAATAALGTMGLLAAMLAITGISGMAAYTVSKRLKELGIRVALGARRAQVMKAAVGRPMLLLAVGSVTGLLSGVLASRLLGQIVYQANPRDPLVMGGAVLTMAFLGIVATAIPARRAIAVDPSQLMRED